MFVLRVARSDADVAGVARCIFRPTAAGRSGQGAFAAMAEAALLPPPSQMIYAPSAQLHETVVGLLGRQIAD
ncbi:MAG: hypothetical protein KIT09_31310 [Bryobacteraceae bacterium]|nr:hypothetical protein [Bryobacteraceae bacterium]